jgi:hypothetical protein
VIERCATLKFGELCDFENKSTLLERFGEVENVDVWKDVQDFDWIKASASPNWSFMRDNNDGDDAVFHFKLHESP